MIKNIETQRKLQMLIRIIENETLPVNILFFGVSNE